MTIRGGVAGLVGASTLPQFRCRGVQTALLAARLAYAQAAGCDIAMGISQPATASQRNLERFGFRIVYTRTKLVGPRMGIASRQGIEGAEGRGLR